MLEERLYQHLNQFVGAFGSILNCLPANYLKSLRTFTSFMPIVFEANIIIKDLNKKYYFRVSLEDYYIKRRNFDFCDLTLSADSKTWRNIFAGKETLMGAFNDGRLLLTNIREQYILKVAFLSGILFSFATKKQRIMRTGKYFKFPLFRREILAPVLRLVFKAFKVIPAHGLERLMKRIGPLLEEE